MTASPGFPPVPLGVETATNVGEAIAVRWGRRVAETINRVLSGKLNAVLPITLAASATSTTIIDARIGYYSALLLQPLTANAAAALYGAPYVLPSAQKSGSVVLNHANAASTDRNFNLLIIG
jgi:hypothetical protein